MSWKSVWWEPSCSMWTEGQTGGHDEANSRFSQFLPMPVKRQCLQIQRKIRHAPAFKSARDLSKIWFLFCFNFLYGNTRRTASSSKPIWKLELAEDEGFCHPNALKRHKHSWVTVRFRRATISGATNTHGLRTVRFKRYNLWRHKHSWVTVRFRRATICGATNTHGLRFASNATICGTTNTHGLRFASDAQPVVRLSRATICGATNTSGMEPWVSSQVVPPCAAYRACDDYQIAVLLN
jgi:hypothetical protein